jgi:predicted GNAT superfamily acetyltransferase
MDQAAILALNNAHAEATSLLSAGQMSALLATAFHVGLADDGRQGFLIALDQDADYDSPNFLWFRQRYHRFAYVDRIVIATAGQGTGRALYTALFAKAAAAGHDRVVCEVNQDPPNPGSDAFHVALGFTPVGHATLPNGKTVQYLERVLTSGS